MEGRFDGICMSCFGQKGYSAICPQCGHSDSPPRTTNHLWPRTVLQNRYLIGTVVGAGGFGVVYKAYDMKLGRVLAIKELFPTSIVNRVAGQREVIVTSQSNMPQFEHMLERFRMEARYLSKLVDSPGVVSVYDCVQENNTAYIIMEYLGGETLDVCLGRLSGRMPAAKAVAIANKLLDGLSAVHRRGIVHRDVKPSNVFIGQNGDVKLIDFGAARYAGVIEDPRMIAAKVFTPGYAPPEQYRNDAAQGEYTDVYAVGATLYFMLTGAAPPPSVDIGAVNRLAEPAQLNPAVPRNISRAVMRAMSIEPQLRYQSAAQFKKALNSSGVDRSEEKERAARKRARRVVAALTVLALLGAAIGGCFYYSRLDDSIAPASMITADETVSVWVPVEPDGEEAARLVYEQLREGFVDYAAGVTDCALDVSFVYIPSQEYGERLAAAPERPDIICGGDYGMALADTRWLRALTEGASLFELEPAGGFVTSFDADVLFVNKKLLEEQGFDADAVGQLGDLSAVGVVHSTMSAFGEYDDAPRSERALQELLSGASPCCIGRTCDAAAVSAALPGYSAALPVRPGAIAAGYRDVFYCCANDNENRVNAAQLFLAYLISDEAQDIQYLRGERGIPANREVYELYRSYRPELAGILGDAKAFVFIN